MLRVLQPGEDKIDLDKQKPAFDEPREWVQSLGKIVAWGELRTCGRAGAASIDDLVAYWGKPKKAKNVTRLAQVCAGHAESQRQEYCVAYDAGALA